MSISPLRLAFFTLFFTTPTLAGPILGHLDASAPDQQGVIQYPDPPPIKPPLQLPDDPHDAYGFVAPFLHPWFLSPEDKGGWPKPIKRQQQGYRKP